MEDVKLFGFKFSPYSVRVKWALKLKGVNYEYIEEDLLNKSELLLQYNPVHKKIPVLVHGGKPIAESMVILEYIDEVWPENPLLPEDAHERSVARFWAKYIDEVTRSMWEFFVKVGEEQEKAIQNNMEILRIIEENGLGHHENKFFGGDTIGIADLAFGWVVYGLKPMEEIVGVSTFIKAETFPRLNTWFDNFIRTPAIKDNLPDSEEVMNFFKKRREAILNTN